MKENNGYSEENVLNDEVNEVILVDEKGNNVHFDHVMTFNYEGKKYAALLPLEEVEGIGENEVLMLEVVHENSEDTYKTVDNEILLDEIFERFLELMDELDEDEEE